MMREEPHKIEDICPNCQGEGQGIVGENLVSMDMSIDAGDRSLEGTHHFYNFAQCEVCEGTGKLLFTEVGKLEDKKSNDRDTRA